LEICLKLRIKVVGSCVLPPPVKK